MKTAPPKTRIGLFDNLAGILKSLPGHYAFADYGWCQGPARNVDLFQKFSDTCGSIEMTGEALIPVEGGGAVAVYLIPSHRAKPFLEFLKIAAVGLPNGDFCRSVVLPPGKVKPLECWFIGYLIQPAPVGSN